VRISESKDSHLLLCFQYKFLFSAAAQSARYLHLVATMVRHVERKAISPGTKKCPAQLTHHLFSVVSLHGILVGPQIKINACPIWATVALCVGGILFRFQRIYCYVHTQCGFKPNSEVRTPEFGLVSAH
jgi:hypothetical protein